MDLQGNFGDPEFRGLRDQVLGIGGRGVGVVRRRSQDLGGEVRGAEIDGARHLLIGRERLAQRPHRFLALPARDPVEHQDAVEVVDLMLDDARLQS